MTTDLPARPWQKVSTDFFELAKVHRDIKPSWDDKPSCHPKAEVSICKMGNSEGTNK